MNTLKLPHRQRGIGLTMVLGVLAGIVVIGAVLALTARNGPSTGNQASNALISGLLSETSSMRAGMDFMAINNGISKSSITFDNAANTGLFHPVDGGSARYTPPAELLANPATDWVYPIDMDLVGVGTDAGADSVLVLPEVTEAACIGINHRLYNTGEATAPPAIGKLLSSFQSAGTTVAMSSETALYSALPSAAQGCFETSDNAYVMFVVMDEA